MALRITILGCGSSTGVPRVGGDWGACDPENPKNRRQRCSILVQKFAPDGASTNVLVDTSPDLRNQMLQTGTGHIDAVLYTHDHADHTHGIDDLRVMALTAGKRVPVYFDRRTGEVVQNRFAYCFATPPGSDYPPILDANIIVPGSDIVISGAGGPITASAFEVTHGTINALGFRFDNVAYLPDVSDIPQASLASLEKLDVWIIDALRQRAHPSHFSLPETLSWIERLAPQRAILTNMHVSLDYETVRRQLPGGVEPAWDGMVFDSWET